MRWLLRRLPDGATVEQYEWLKPSMAQQTVTSDDAAAATDGATAESCQKSYEHKVRVHVARVFMRALALAGGGARCVLAYACVCLHAYMHTTNLFQVCLLALVSRREFLDVNFFSGRFVCLLFYPHF